jgi:hypothetical protein
MKKPMNKIPGLAVSLLLLGLGSAAAQIALKPDFPFLGKILFPDWH